MNKTEIKPGTPFCVFLLSGRKFSRSTRQAKSIQIELKNGQSHVHFRSLFHFIMPQAIEVVFPFFHLAPRVSAFYCPDTGGLSRQKKNDRKEKSLCQPRRCYLAAKHVCGRN